MSSGFFNNLFSSASNATPVGRAMTLLPYAVGAILILIIVIFIFTYMMTKKSAMTVFPSDSKAKKFAKKIASKFGY